MRLKRIAPILLISYYLLNSILFGVLRDEKSIKYIPFIAIGYFLLIKNNKSQLNKKTALLSVVFSGYVLLNYFLAPNQEFFFQKLIFYILNPICIIISITYALYNKEDIITRLINSRVIIWGLNIFCILNMIVISLQSMGIPLFIHLDGTAFAYYDQIDGFFGLNGTPNWALFLGLIFIINYEAYIHSNKFVYIILSIVEGIISCIQSLTNDNKGLFIIYFLTIILLTYHYLTLKSSNKQRIIKYLIAILVVLASVLWIFNSSSQVALFIRVNVFGYILMPFGYTGEIDLMHTNERWETFIYALENLNGYGFGMGIGWRDSVLGVAHFGISELSYKTGYGGIVYYLLWILISVYITTAKKTQLKYLIKYIVIWILFTIFTRVYTDYHSCILATFYVLAIRYTYRDVERSGATQ